MNANILSVIVFMISAIMHSIFIAMDDNRPSLWIDEFESIFWL